MAKSEKDKTALNNIAASFVQKHKPSPKTTLRPQHSVVRKPPEKTYYTVNARQDTHELLRELGLFLFNNGVKPKDSPLFRAALHFVPKNQEFIQTYLEVSAREKKELES